MTKESLFLILIGFIIFSQLHDSKAIEKLNTKKIYLYEGYLAKQEGVLLWCPQSPLWSSEKEKFEFKIDVVNVTSAIHDPWPFTSGDKNCIMMVEGN